MRLNTIIEITISAIIALFLLAFLPVAIFAIEKRRKTWQLASTTPQKNSFYWPA